MAHLSAVDFVVGHIVKPGRKPAHAIIMQGDEPIAETTTNLIEASFDKTIRAKSASEVMDVLCDDKKISFILISTTEIPADIRTRLENATSENLRLWIVHTGRPISRRRRKIGLTEFYKVEAIVPRDLEKHAFIRDIRKNLIERMLEQYHEQSTVRSA